MNLSHDSDEDLFDFNNEVPAEPDFSAPGLSTDQQFKRLKDTINNYSNKLSAEKYFNHYYYWKTPFPNEPISVNTEPIDSLTGVFDLIKSNNIFLNKVLSVFSILHTEVYNILKNGEYEILFPLIVYGESADDDEKIEDGEAENQIAKMLPFFNELFEKVTKLLSISINILNQCGALYNKSNKNYNESFNKISLFKPFEYLGKILSFFLAIDTVVEENTNLTAHWKLYRLMFNRCKGDPNKFGFTDDQSRKLERVIKKLEGSILSGKLYYNCLNHLINNTGELLNNQMVSLSKNKEFISHLTNFFKIKFEKLNTDINCLTETNEKTQFFQVLSVFGYYNILMKTEADKKFFKLVWAMQKKLTHVPIVSHVLFNVEKFMKGIHPFGDKFSYDPKNIPAQRIENLNKFLSTFKFLITNLKVQVLTWVTRLESDAFKEITNEKENIKKMISNQIKLIINGVILAHQIKNSLIYFLNTLLIENVEMKAEYLPLVICGFEILKSIEYQFNKNKTIINLRLNMMTRLISFQIQSILSPVEKKMNSKMDSYKSDIQSTIQIINALLTAAPTKMRMIINELCFDIIKTKNHFDSNQIDDLNFHFWKLEIMSRLSSEIKSVCETSFFYWYRDIIPECLNVIYNSHIDFKRIHFFTLAISDIQNPLFHVKYLSDNTVLVKKLRENIRKIYHENVIFKLAKDVENDLRMQIHSILITNLQLPNPCKGEIKDLRRYLNVGPLYLFETVINIKECIEEYLNKTFYDMTTMNLNDWKTYQQMRGLARTKFSLDLHDVYLPSQTLEQGIDILFIIRNINTFVTQYNYNLQSQIFIEVTKENNYVSVIGVQQILNSLCTHGIGIVNTIVNKTYQFLVSRIKVISQFLFDEYIKSSLMMEKRYWNEWKEKIQNKYPYERAENLCNDIKNLEKNSDVSLVDKLRIFISQIGNALGFIRTIRTALTEYNSQNLKFFSNNISELEKYLNNIENPDIEFKTTNTIFQETLNLLDQNKINNINYLKLLVSSFESVFNDQKAQDLDLFYYLIPAVTINYVENLIVAKDNIFKKNVKNAYFTDDGFILGFTYLLKVFKQDEAFENLHWFQSVIDKNDKDGAVFNTQKNKKDEMVQQNMSLRKINIYKKEFELLCFTYNTAMILFNDY
jgi:WASH complex subunit 7